MSAIAIIKNCGTGAGGFQSGNTCASGDGAGGNKTNGIDWETGTITTADGRELQVETSPVYPPNQDVNFPFGGAESTFKAAQDARYVEMLNAADKQTVLQDASVLEDAARYVNSALMMNSEDYVRAEVINPNELDPLLRIGAPNSEWEILQAQVDQPNFIVDSLQKYGGVTESQLQSAKQEYAKQEQTPQWVELTQEEKEKVGRNIFEPLLRQQKNATDEQVKALTGVVAQQKLSKPITVVRTIAVGDVGEETPQEISDLLKSGFINHDKLSSWTVSYHTAEKFAEVADQSGKQSVQLRMTTTEGLVNKNPFGDFRSRTTQPNQSNAQNQWTLQYAAGVASSEESDVEDQRELIKAPHKAKITRIQRQGDRWLVDLQEVVAEVKKSVFTKNCGTGAGGFQEGNTCASGDGGGASITVTESDARQPLDIAEMDDDTQSAWDSLKNAQDQESKKLIKEEEALLDFYTGIGSEYMNDPDKAELSRLGLYKNTIDELGLKDSWWVQAEVNADDGSSGLTKDELYTEIEDEARNHNAMQLGVLKDRLNDKLMKTKIDCCQTIVRGLWLDKEEIPAFLSSGFVEHVNPNSWTVSKDVAERFSGDRILLRMKQPTTGLVNTSNSVRREYEVIRPAGRQKITAVQRTQNGGYLIDLEEFEQSAKKSLRTKNCGTGWGGFQQGNTCASGTGEASEARVDFNNREIVTSDGRQIAIEKLDTYTKESFGREVTYTDVTAFGSDGTESIKQQMQADTKRFNQLVRAGEAQDALKDEGVLQDAMRYVESGNLMMDSKRYTELPENATARDKLTLLRKIVKHPSFVMQNLERYGGVTKQEFDEKIDEYTKTLGYNFDHLHATPSEYDKEVVDKAYEIFKPLLEKQKAATDRQVDSLTNIVSQQKLKQPQTVVRAIGLTNDQLTNMLKSGVVAHPKLNSWTVSERTREEFVGIAGRSAKNPVLLRMTTSSGLVNRNPKLSGSADFGPIEETVLSGNVLNNTLQHVALKDNAQIGQEMEIIKAPNKAKIVRVRKNEDNDLWVIDLEEIQATAKQKSFVVKNCGTGAGGFQEGNTCASGGGETTTTSDGYEAIGKTDVAGVDVITIADDYKMLSFTTQDKVIEDKSRMSASNLFTEQDVEKAKVNSTLQAMRDAQVESGESDIKSDGSTSMEWWSKRGYKVLASDQIRNHDNASALQKQANRSEMFVELPFRDTDPKNKKLENASPRLKELCAEFRKQDFAYEETGERATLKRQLLDEAIAETNAIRNKIESGVEKSRFNKNVALFRTLNLNQDQIKQVVSQGHIDHKNLNSWTAHPQGMQWVDSANVLLRMEDARHGMIVSNNYEDDGLSEKEILRGPSRLQIVSVYQEPKRKNWVINVREDARFKKSVATTITTKNCGTGAGGFQSGNTCASGGGAGEAEGSVDWDAQEIKTADGRTIKIEDVSAKRGVFNEITTPFGSDELRDVSRFKVLSQVASAQTALKDDGTLLDAARYVESGNLMMKSTDYTTPKGGSMRADQQWADLSVMALHDDFYMQNLERYGGVTEQEYNDVMKQYREEEATFKIASRRSFITKEEQFKLHQEHAKKSMSLWMPLLQKQKEATDKQVQALTKVVAEQKLSMPITVVRAIGMDISTETEPEKLGKMLASGVVNHNKLSSWTVSDQTKNTFQDMAKGQKVLLRMETKRGLANVNPDTDIRRFSREDIERTGTSEWTLQHAARARLGEVLGSNIPQEYELIKAPHSARIKRVQRDQNMWLVDLEEIEEPTKTKTYRVKNCGTGAGGFQEGNTCARGGGGGADANAARFPAVINAEQAKEYQKDSITKDFKVLAHATRAENVASIEANGFRVNEGYTIGGDGGGVGGDVWGRGVYISTDRETEAFYSDLMGAARGKSETLQLAVDIRKPMVVNTEDFRFVGDRDKWGIGLNTTEVRKYVIEKAGYDWNQFSKEVDDEWDVIRDAHQAHLKQYRVKLQNAYDSELSDDAKMLLAIQRDNDFYDREVKPILKLGMGFTEEDAYEGAVALKTKMNSAKIKAANDEIRAVTKRTFSKYGKEQPDSSMHTNFKIKQALQAKGYDAIVVNSLTQSQLEQRADVSMEKERWKRIGGNQITVFDPKRVKVVRNV